MTSLMDLFIRRHGGCCTAATTTISLLISSFNSQRPTSDSSQEGRSWVSARSDFGCLFPDVWPGEPRCGWRQKATQRQLINQTRVDFCLMAFKKLHHVKLIFFFNYLNFKMCIIRKIIFWKIKTDVPFCFFLGGFLLTSSFGALISCHTFELYIYN